MNWHTDKDSHERDIGADDSDASNQSGQYWLSNGLLTNLYLMAVSEVHGCEFVELCAAGDFGYFRIFSIYLLTGTFICRANY